MRCPQCQHENPEGGCFCNACGAKLEATCPVCEHVNTPGSRFCNACGHNLTIVTPQQVLSETEQQSQPLLLQQSSDNDAEVEFCFHKAISIGCRQQAKSWQLRAATSLDRLLQQLGKHQAHDLPKPVYGWFTEGFDTGGFEGGEGAAPGVGRILRYTNQKWRTLCIEDRHNLSSP
jgi:hypothetical protein